MVADPGPGPGPGQGSGSKPASTFESSGDRLRFTVELRPGETTIVSWKKLIREATSAKTNEPGPSVSGPSTETHEQPVLQAQPPPPATASSSVKQPTENEANDSDAQAGSNRLSNVIERIERMYAGNGSSDEEDVVLNDIPDDDEYDTEDSFIDDAELDDYFQVDNSTIKHDGFFVNRGKLERTEPTISMTQQPKKRRRKDIDKGHGGSDDACNPNKHVKIGNKGKNASSLMERNFSSQSYKVDVPNVHGDDVQFNPSPANAPEVSLKKKTLVSKFTVDPSALSSCDVIRQDKDIDQQRTGAPVLKKHNNKLKQSSQVQDTSTQRPNYKSAAISKSSTGKQLNNKSEHDQSIQLKEKSGLVDRFDLNIPATTDCSPTTKVSITKRKTGSAIKAKSSTLEKAIRDLEKIVAESRPPSVEVQDPDNSSQAVKRRLPPEIKQKLAKVARLAQATYGKAPNDLIDRLMGTVGHLMQLRTLKRNLRIMAKMGLSAKQEKDDLVQKTKQEVAEMVKMRITYMESKLEQQTTNSDDFQEAGPEEKEALKRKYRIDGALENKICDLYDLYVERVEEDAGPPVRRLYEELSALWPGGVMDTEGIKRAIYRAKDRRKALGKPMKDQEKIKKRKMVTPKAEDGCQGEAAISTQPSHFLENLFPQSRDHASTLSSMKITSAARMPEVFVNGPNTGMPKQEKAKGSSTSNLINLMPVDVLPKKKKKKKPNTEIQFRLEKLVGGPQAEESDLLHNHVAVPFAKSNLQHPTPSGFEIPSLPDGLLGPNP